MYPNTNQPNFVFWVNSWRRYLLFGRVIDRKKAIKCIINPYEIRTDEGIQPGDPPIYILFNTIIDYKLSSLNDASYIYTLRISTAEQYSIVLVPTNPFEPSLLLHFNEHEAQAMVAVISAFKQGTTPTLSNNPYTRQLQQNDVPKYIREIEEVWDEAISPWVYYRKYNKNADKVVDIYEKFFTTLYILFLLGGAIYLIWQFFFH